MIVPYIRAYGDSASAQLLNLQIARGILSHNPNHS